MLSVRSGRTPLNALFGSSAIGRPSTRNVVKARGLVQNPPKPKVTSREDAFIHAMPAYLGGSDRIGIKWVAGYEQNHAKAPTTN